MRCEKPLSETLVAQAKEKCLGPLKRSVQGLNHFYETAGLEPLFNCNQPSRHLQTRGKDQLYAEEGVDGLMPGLRGEGPKCSPHEEEMQKCRKRSCPGEDHGARHVTKSFSKPTRRPGATPCGSPLQAQT